MLKPYVTFTLRGLPFLLISSFVAANIFFLPYAYGEPNGASSTLISATDPVPKASPSDAFIEKPIFKENEQSSVLLNPVFNDNSTNIAFYMKCPNVACPDNGTASKPEYVFSAENLGHGTLPFSDYWAPPTLTDFSAIEYNNDNQQFTCSDKTLDACTADAHFVAITYFTLVSNTTTITPEMIAAKTSLIVPTGSSSISSNLSSSTFVTATIDGTLPSNDSTATASETPRDSIGSFVSAVVNKIINAILPGDQSGTSTTTDTPTGEPTLTPSTSLTPPSETPTSDTTTHEPITAQF